MIGKESLEVFSRNNYCAFPDIPSHNERNIDEERIREKWENMQSDKMETRFGELHWHLLILRSPI